MKDIVILFRERESDKQEIERYLRQYEAEFIPTIASRVDLREYAKKISQNACVFWVMCDQRKIGMCAIYMNRDNQGFITSINIAKEFGGRGVGSRLMEQIVCEAKGRVSQIKLEVSKENKAAVSFYKKNNFKIEKEKNEWYEMVRQL